MTVVEMDTGYERVTVLMLIENILTLPLELYPYALQMA